VCGIVSPGGHTDENSRRVGSSILVDVFGCDLGGSPVAVVVLLMAVVGMAHASGPNAVCTQASCAPLEADIVKSGATTVVTLTLRDSGSHVSYWGDPLGATCKAGVCDVHVQYRTVPLERSAM
jgi:hypothetical protein